MSHGINTIFPFMTRRHDWNQKRFKLPSVEHFDETFLSVESTDHDSHTVERKGKFDRRKTRFPTSMDGEVGEGRENAPCTISRANFNLQIWRRVETSAFRVGSIRFQLILVHGNSMSMTHRQIQFQHGGGGRFSDCSLPCDPSFHSIPSLLLSVKWNLILMSFVGSKYHVPK